MAQQDLKERGSIPLQAGAKLESRAKDIESKKGLFMFEMVLSQGETYFLGAPTADERLQWLKSINHALVIFTKRFLATKTPGASLPLLCVWMNE